MNYAFQSVFSETWGLSKNRKEKLVDYIKRVYNDPIIRNSNCFAIRESQSHVLAKMNALIGHYENTYYFSMATGERKIQR